MVENAPAGGNEGEQQGVAAAGGGGAVAAGGGAGGGGGGDGGNPVIAAEQGNLPPGVEPVIGPPAGDEEAASIEIPDAQGNADEVVDEEDDALDYTHDILFVGRMNGKILFDKKPHGKAKRDMDRTIRTHSERAIRDGQRLCSERISSLADFFLGIGGNGYRCLVRENGEGSVAKQLTRNRLGNFIANRFKTASVNEAKTRALQNERMPERLVLRAKNSLIEETDGSDEAEELTKRLLKFIKTVTDKRSAYHQMAVATSLERSSSDTVFVELFTLFNKRDDHHTMRERVIRLQVQTFAEASTPTTKREEAAFLKALLDRNAPTGQLLDAWSDHSTESTQLVRDHCRMLFDTEEPVSDDSG